MRFNRVDTLPFFVGMIFFILGLYLTILLGKNIIVISNSVKSPWGIVTSNFIFDGINNLEWYFWFLILLWVTSLPYQVKTRKQRYLSSIYSMFISAMVANGIWLYMIYIGKSNLTSGGESSVVFGFVGACFSLFLIDSLINLSGFMSSKIFKKKSIVNSLKSASKIRRWIGGFISPFVSIAVLADLTYARATFFNEFPKVNYFVHIAGFYAGFLIATGIYCWGLYRLTKKEINVDTSNKVTE